MAVALGTRDRARQIELLDRALEADPQFVDAWIRKSAQHAFLAGITTGDESARHSAEAQAAIDYALELKPDSPYAHAVRATQLGQAGEWIDSELEWRHAFALDVRAGNDALLQLAVGNVTDAAAELEDVLIDDPKNDGARSLLLLAYTVLDDKDKRRWHWRRGEELHGSWMGDAIEPGLRLMEGDREFVLSTTDHRHSAQARIWHAGKDNLDSPEDGLAAMRALRDEPELRNAMNLRAMATWALYFGNTELGLAWFSESVELEATGMMSAWLPGFAELRREPGFKDLLRSQGLPEYWNRFEKWPTAFCRPTTGDDFECE
jgi:hypothetical protein